MSTRLERLRNHAEALETQMSVAEGSAYASLSGRYMEALKQIEELEAGEAESDREATPLDEFTKRLAARKPRTAGRSISEG